MSVGYKPSASVKKKWDAAIARVSKQIVTRVDDSMFLEKVGEKWKPKSKRFKPSSLKVELKRLCEYKNAETFWNANSHVTRQASALASVRNEYLSEKFKLVTAPTITRGLKGLEKRNGVKLSKDQREAIRWIMNSVARSLATEIIHADFIQRPFAELYLEIINEGHLPSTPVGNGWKSSKIPFV